MHIASGIAKLSQRSNNGVKWNISFKTDHPVLYSIAIKLCLVLLRVKGIMVYDDDKNMKA